MSRPTRKKPKAIDDRLPKVLKMPPLRSATWVNPAVCICSSAWPDRLPLWQYTA